MNEKKTSSYVAPHKGTDNTAPYPVSRLAPGFSLVDLAKEIEQADSMLNTTAHARLRVIADQVIRLKEEARKVLEETQLNQQLHRASCHFKKIPGKVYHLYQKPDQQLYFSMLSPDEWGSACLHAYQGSYRLEPDMSWKPAEECQHDDQASINGLLDSL